MEDGSASEGGVRRSRLHLQTCSADGDGWTRSSTPVRDATRVVCHGYKSVYGCPRTGAITMNMTFDGSCDDGEAGSYYAHCTWGTDCGDCGDRVVFGPKAPPEPPAPPA